MRHLRYFALVILLGCVCAGAQQHPGSEPYTPTRIDWLTLTLQAALRDDSMANGYLLEIASSDPETIVIYVRYTSKVDRQVMNTAIDTARKVINTTAKSYGWDKWVKIREDIELTK
jgi:hypothetical protein